MTTQSDAPAGLIHAKRLDGAGGADEVAWSELSSAGALAEQLWLHFDFEDPQAQRWLENDSQLNDVAYRALISDETRPRSLNRGDNLLLTLRGINHNRGAEPEDMVSLRLWTDGKRLITTRRRQLASTRDVIDELNAGSGPRSTVELLVYLIERITDRMSDTIESFEDELLDIEGRLLSDQTDGIRSELSMLRKRTVSVRRYLSPQREAMNRLVNEGLSWIDEMSRLKLREATDRLIRHIENMDEVRDRAALAQEELASRIAEQLNARSYLFTVAAVIFLPLGFLTGLLGINVGGVPGSGNDEAFWIVLALCIGISALLGLLLHVRRWL
ncbi:MAG: zinc transporter ZntB [Congregibacter sp.]